jgi:hypothetical protein
MEIFKSAEQAASKAASAAEKMILDKSRSWRGPNTALVAWALQAARLSELEPSKRVELLRGLQPILSELSKSNA